MTEKLKIFCINNRQYVEMPAGSSLLQVLEQLNLPAPYVLANAKVNNKTESLHYILYHPKQVEFIDISHPSGIRTYVRTLCFVFAKAVHDIYPGAQLKIEHPISKGYFCKIEGMENGALPDIEAIKEKMRSYIERNIELYPREEESTTVASYFRGQGFHDKALLIETAHQLYTKYYRLEDYTDSFYGCLLPSTGCLQVWDICPYKNGMLLRIPNRLKPEELEPMPAQDKMYEVYREHLNLQQITGVENVGDLNLAIQNGNVSDTVKISEAWQEQAIAKIANTIADRFNEGVRIVLISGPSSSGKTTFRKRLEVQLLVNGLKPAGISLDDYFVERENTPRDEHGDYDYESLYALDLPLFNSQIADLLQGEKVSLPTYNFTTGKREFKGNSLQMHSDNILLIEGIHGLNPELTAQIPAEAKFKIYVSALTCISLDHHNWISTSDNRFLRRLVRDYKYRSYSAIDTIRRWNSVREGEDRWIFPYQENADVMFNSAMLYELAALRRNAESVLLQVPKNAPEYAEAYRFIKFLSCFNYLGDRELPPTSLLREFLGGSSFKY